ncbi:C-type lectin-1 [Aphelenchoides avenae]|nr:C-type lectin-1 [Aphelenchus avenae]
MDASDALNGDSNRIRRPAFEPVRPWTLREKCLLGIAAVLCFVFVVTLIAFMRPQPRCAPGWSKHEGHCYKLLERKSFYEANHECRHDYGAELASVHSKSLSYFLGGLAAKKLHDEHLGAWIGLQRGKGASSEWVWTDGTSLDFENWSTNKGEDEVETSKHSCALIVNSNHVDSTRWVSRLCEQKNETAICQKKLRTTLLSIASRHSLP